MSTESNGPLLEDYVTAIYITLNCLNIFLSNFVKGKLEN